MPKYTSSGQKIATKDWSNKRRSYIVQIILNTDSVLVQHFSRPYKGFICIVSLILLVTFPLAIKDTILAAKPNMLPKLVEYWSTELYAIKTPCDWPTPELKGRQKVITDVLSFEEIEEVLDFMKKGQFTPEHCFAYQRVAVIVPYRDRDPQLKGFLINVLPKLKRQRLDFTIYVVEQEPGQRFNRGMMRNIGFLEADKTREYDCFIFHDVDIIPENDYNLYTCGDQPRHLSGLMDRHNYTLLYKGLMGGIVAFRREQFVNINGYSNQFFVWGGEDDELYRRIKEVNYTVDRPNQNVSHSSGLQHEKSPKETERLEIFHAIHDIWREDGVSSTKYTLTKQIDKPLFRWFLVSINETQIVQERLDHPLIQKRNKENQIRQEEIEKRNNRKRDLSNDKH